MRSLEARNLTRSGGTLSVRETVMGCRKPALPPLEPFSSLLSAEMNNEEQEAKLGHNVAVDEK